MRVTLFQLDGSVPNIALMRLAAHHRALGDEVSLRHVGNGTALDKPWYDAEPDRVYASLIFERTRPLAESLLRLYPDAILGGTGWDLTTTVEQYGITTLEQDYSIYPKFTASIGFTQRGCRLNCPFCVVPRKEGKVAEAATIADIWRGDPYPRNLLLLDNDFFGQPHWRDRIREIRDGGFKVSFNQGINARMLNDETAAAVASVRYSDDGFKVRRIYTAWDSLGDERVLLRGLESLKRHGVRPRAIMVYMLIDYEADGDVRGWEYRRAKLREFGALPFPMAWIPPGEERARPLARGFARWVIGAFDKRVPWAEWEAAKCQPRNLGDRTAPKLFDVA